MRTDLLKGSRKRREDDYKYIYKHGERASSTSGKAANSSCLGPQIVQPIQCDPQKPQFPLTLKSVSLRFRNGETAGSSRVALRPKFRQKPKTDFADRENPG